MKTKRVMTLVESRELRKSLLVYLARAVKDAQTNEKCCYYCSSPEHFICNCPFIKTSRKKKQLNGKEGDDINEGSPDQCHKEPPYIVS